MNEFYEKIQYINICLIFWKEAISFTAQPDYHVENQDFISNILSLQRAKEKW